MAPSRRKGVSKAAAAAAARRQWKVGDLVLAKVKGFPAWPAKVGEPESLGFAADWKKVVVHFFGTKPEQIGFCNPADVEAFTEEKKQSLLVKRQGRSADFLRAVQEIIDSFEKLKQQDQDNDLNSGAEVTQASVGNSVDLLAKSNDQTEAPEAMLSSELKNSYSPTDKKEPSLPVEDTSVLLDREALREESTDTEVVTETPLPSINSSRKRSNLSQPQSCVTHRKSQRSRCSSRLESRRSRSLVMPCNDTGKNAGDASRNVIPDSSLRRNRRVRKSPDVSELDDVDFAAFVSNGSIEENSSEVVTVDSDTFSLNEGSTIESGCKVEHSDTVVECFDGDVELGKGLDLQIKAVFIKKKRKPNRKRVTNDTAVPPATLDKEISLEVEAQNNSLNSQSGCEEMKERCLKEDGDEHLPLVKRARVRMGKSSSVEEKLKSCSPTEEITKTEVTVHPSEQMSMLECENNDLADRDLLGINGAHDNVSSPTKYCTEVSAKRSQPWKERKEQSFGCSVDGEAALPPSKRLHRALEAMSANAAEEGEACNEASRTLTSGVSGSSVSSMNESPQMAVESKVGNGVCLLGMDSVGNISSQVGCSGFSTCLNPIIAEENTKSSLEVEFRSQPVDNFETQSHESPKDVFPDARDHGDGVDRHDSFGCHNVRTTIPTQSQGYSSPNLDERQANPGSNEPSLDPLSPPKAEGDTENIELNHCEARISDRDADASRNTGMSLGPVSCSNEILKASPRKDTIVLQCSAEGAGFEENKCLKPQMNGRSNVNCMCEVVKDVRHYPTQEGPRSHSFSDDHICQKYISGIRSSPSLTVAGDSFAQASPPHSSNYLMSTSGSCNFVENNGSCSPDVQLQNKKTSGASLVDEEEKIEAVVIQRPKSVSKHGEAHVALSSFEAMLGTLTRTKESIGRATRIAIDCAKFGVAAKVVEILTYSLEMESSLHHRVDLFFLVDSITQCSRGLKGDVGGIYPSAIQAVLPRILAAAAPPGNIGHENRKQCLRVLRLWLERKIIPESIVRHHMRELESLSGSSSAGPYSRRSSRTERALDDPVREMEGMLVDEYGSNSSFQLPGFCMPRMLKEDNEGSDSDGESFEAVTPEHNFESREECESLPAIEKHRHILEDVDGELEMEDVAPYCEVETGSSFHVAEVNAVQILHNQYEQHVPMPFAPPLPQDVPPSSPPLPLSPPPPPPPPPPRAPVHPPSSMSDPYTNGVDSQLYVDTHNTQDNLVQSVVQQPVAPRAEQTIHNRSPEFRDPQMQMAESASCSLSSFSVQPANNGRQTNSGTLRDKAYTIRPPHPAPSDQFSYFQGDQRVRPRRDAPPPSYSNRFHYMQNVDRENSYNNNHERMNNNHERMNNNYERMKLSSYELHDHWRYDVPPFSGPRYPSKGRMSYAPAPFDGPPCEPTRLPGQGWRFPPRTMNHRNAISYRPPFEGPIPVAGRGPSFWRPR